MIGLSIPNYKIGIESLVQIVKVHCPQCYREFRTVPSVVDHAGAVYCPQCGTRMNVSEPLSISILSESRKASAA